MKTRIKQAVGLALAAGFGLAASTAAFSAESLQDVMKRRGLSQQDLMAAAKTYVPTGKRDEFLAFSSGGQSGQI
ncbi:MAG: hypothetical protein KDF24_10310, partial [Rhodocyclaceae bacterium]|nr:hypothetical protein [Rhodocyclaceae bacterium]